MGAHAPTRAPTRPCAQLLPFESLLPWRDFSLRVREPHYSLLEFVLKEHESETQLQAYATALSRVRTAFTYNPEGAVPGDAFYMIAHVLARRRRGSRAGGDTVLRDVKLLPSVVGGAGWERARLRNALSLARAHPRACASLACQPAAYEDMPGWPVLHHADSRGASFDSPTGSSGDDARVCIATHLSSDRVDLLIKMAARWDGVVSAAVLVKGAWEDGRKGVEVVLE